MYAPKNGDEFINDSYDNLESASKNLLAKPSSGRSRTDFVGCSGIHYKRVGKRFHLRSEMVMRSQEMGMVLWSSVNNRENPWLFMNMNVRFTHYALFLEKERGRWRIRTGFAWGTHSPETMVEARDFEIVFPRGDRTRIDLVDSDENRNEVREYYDLWSENGHGLGERGREMINLGSPLYDRSQRRSKYHYDMKRIQGYGEPTNTFYPRNADGSDPGGS